MAQEYIGFSPMLAAWNAAVGVLSSRGHCGIMPGVPSTVPLLLFCLVQFAQPGTGELRLMVTDPSGLPLQSAVELVSEANQFRQQFATDGQGALVTRRLPFGAYRVSVRRDGFATATTLVEIASAVPTELRVSVAVAGLDARVLVTAAQTLVDPHQTTVVNRIGADTLQQRTTALPGRSLPDLVNSQPGWLLEANGILHPRASEYQTQYVVDGLPFTDNRSPAFAPEVVTDDVRALQIRTGGYPAEYGRKLGGVIEVVTTGQPREGWHGSVSSSAGSFDTLAGNAAAEYGWTHAVLGVSGGGADTDRFLDPPVEENHTNHGTTSHVAVRFESDLTASDRLGLAVRHGGAAFLVPNERVQQEAGQRQDRDTRETAAQMSYQRVVSKRAVADLRGMARTLSARLRSNEQATPVAATQDRGLREAYLKGTISAHAGAHELKAGGDLTIGRVRESFGYTLTDPGTFDPGTPSEFSFAGRQTSSEQSLFVQDQMRVGPWTLNAGLRWDRYDLVVTEQAFSPRLAAAWSRPESALVVRVSYDRAFQTPAFENLLLASSPLADGLDDEVAQLPVRPSRGNFYEAGISKGLLGRLRLDATAFSRTMRDAADDDLLLNTGVSFPIAFRRAEVTGVEVKLETPQWKRVSGYLGYGRMRAVADLPATGGLFLGEEGAAVLESSERLPSSQDQRHTLRGRLAYQFDRRGWVALAGAYGSGLPFEDFDGDSAGATAQFGPRVVERVDFETGRVKASWSFDASAGAVLAQTAARSLRLQVEVRNLTNRLNVINFAGLFSGTAIAPPRGLSIRLAADF